MLEYKIGQPDSVLTIEMSGKLTMCQGSQALVKDLNALSDESNVRVLFDCEKVEMLDSSGIGVLVVCKKVLDDAGGALAIYVSQDGMMNRAITSTSLGQIFKIFFDRKEAVDYLKACHQAPSEIRDFLLNGIKNYKAIQEDLLMNEIHYQKPELEDALTLVEEIALQLEANGAAPISVAAQQNRLILFLAKLAGRYGAKYETTEKTALIIDRDMFVLAGYMVDLYLQNMGWLTMNLAGMRAESKRVMELAKSFSPRLIVICPGTDSKIDKMLDEARGFKSLSEDVKVAIYVPIFQTINQNPPEDEQFVIATRIKDFANRFGGEDLL